MAQISLTFPDGNAKHFCRRGIVPELARKCSTEGVKLVNEVCFRLDVSLAAAGGVMKTFEFEWQRGADHCITGRNRVTIESREYPVRFDPFEGTDGESLSDRVLQHRVQQADRTFGREKSHLENPALLRIQRPNPQVLHQSCRKRSADQTQPAQQPL